MSWEEHDKLELTGMDVLKIFGAAVLLGVGAWLLVSASFVQAGLKF